MFNILKKLHINNKKYFCTITESNADTFKIVLDKVKNTFNFLNQDNDKIIEESKKKLSNDQIKDIEILAYKISELNFYQAAYYDLLLEENAVKNKKITHLYANTNWTKIVQMDNCPPINPAYFKQQEFMADFTKWLSSVKPIDLGFGTTATATQKTQSKSEVKAEDVKMTKSVVDIELTSFDASRKIVLIKEVRAILNLGLKEAKDAVDSAPKVLFKAVKKEDYEEIIKKLTDNGAVISFK